MAGRLTDKVAIVTGAGQGIGAAIARSFAAEGARVVVAERNSETGQAVADEIGGHFVQTDDPAANPAQGSYLGSRVVPRCPPPACTHVMSHTQR